MLPADDESLFFAPSILAHQSDKRHLVSLSIGASSSNSHRLRLIYVESIGDSEGEGSIRQQELASSCQVLGITAEHCVSLNDTYVCLSSSNTFSDLKQTSSGLNDKFLVYRSHRIPYQALPRRLGHFTNHHLRPVRYLRSHQPSSPLKSTSTEMHTTISFYPS